MKEHLLAENLSCSTSKLDMHLSHSTCFHEYHYVIQLKKTHVCHESFDREMSLGSLQHLKALLFSLILRQISDALAAGAAWEGYICNYSFISQISYLFFFVILYLLEAWHDY